MAKHDTTVETYGLEQNDIGPVLEVRGDRGGGAHVGLDVGYWGIGIRLDPAQTTRLRDQLNRILGVAG